MPTQRPLFSRLLLGTSYCSEVFNELRDWGNTAYQEAIASPGTRNVKELSLSLVDILQVARISYARDSGLQWKDIVVARHHHHSFELEAFRQVHRRDRHLIRIRVHMLVEHVPRQVRGFNRNFRAVNLSIRAHENTKLVRLQPCRGCCAKPFCNSLRLIIHACRCNEFWRRPVGIFVFGARGERADTAGASQVHPSLSPPVGVLST